MPNYYWLLGVYLSCLAMILIYNQLNRSFAELPVLEQDLSMQYKTLVHLSKLLSAAHRIDRNSQVKDKLLYGLQLLTTITRRLRKKMKQVPAVPWDKIDHYMYRISQAKSEKQERLHKTVKILAFADGCEKAQHLLDSIANIYPKIRVHLAIRVFNRLEKRLGPRKCRPRMIHSVQPTFWLEETAEMWVQLAKQSRSEYLLIGRNMVEFTQHTNLSHMLEVRHKLSADVVGGSVKLIPEGRWFQGCYQMALRNFTVRIVPGYDLADYSCAYCDYLASPILISRELFLSHMNKQFASPGVAPFVDMFLRLKQSETPRLFVACTDVLFTVSGNQDAFQRGLGVYETQKSRWLELAQRWQLNKILLPGDLEHHWSCNDVGIKCSQFLRPGLILPPCCIQELVDAVKTFVSLANTFNISTCLFSGNIVGAVKLYSGILPWERDSDIGWDASKFKILTGSMKRILEKYGYKLGPRKDYTEFGTDIEKCRKKTQNTCIYYGLKTPTFNLELYGEPFLVSQALEGLQQPTLVNVDGIWMPTVPNPGRVIRHQFGDNVLLHIQHWRDYRAPTFWSSTYMQLQPFNFLPCPYDAPMHACLDGNFAVTGNIQFQDVVV